ncbi:hypothetical protein [Streptacidiphilus carbonis]|uniref:hypothetical protein n=1 Tax=Streptacidiphilus carbonis TaxID=105422 RepID=UPI0005AAE86B|nr:hypothetical protein [Streptacidiphilus carbonis]
MPGGGDTNVRADRPTALGGPALVVAIAAIAVWLGLLFWLAVDAGATEVAWSRLLIVLGSVEAVAFAAIGALFGTTVQRQRVEDLKSRSDAAESRAEAHEQEALNGQKLAAAVRVTFDPGTAAASAIGTELLSADTSSSLPGGGAPLLALVDRLFPEPD